MTEVVFVSRIVVFLLLLAACGGGLSGAKSDFKSGRIDDAKDKLVALEGESQGWSGSKKADYVLYRGLVAHALGDRDVAADWLRQAKALEDAAPNTYSEDDRTRLELALEALGQR